MKIGNYYIGLIRISKENGFNINCSVHICKNCSYIGFKLFSFGFDFIFYVKKKDG